MRNYLCLIVGLVAILSACATPKAPISDVEKFNLILGMAADPQYAGKTICANFVNIGGIIESFNEYSRAHPEKDSWHSLKDIYQFLASNHPCPFNPALKPVRHAANNDMVGRWELVPASLEIKINVFQRDPFPQNCEYFSFYEDGDMRSFQMLTKNACPVVTAEDFKNAKALPKAINWKLGSDGLLKITRTDNPTYVESWEAFIVTSPFYHHAINKIQFKPGDLLLFMTKFNNVKREEVGTLYFRQFRKMAGS